jgi:hypothetical protein
MMTAEEFQADWVEAARYYPETPALADFKLAPIIREYAVELNLEDLSALVVYSSSEGSGAIGLSAVALLQLRRGLAGMARGAFGFRRSARIRRRDLSRFRADPIVAHAAAIWQVQPRQAVLRIGTHVGQHKGSADLRLDAGLAATLRTVTLGRTAVAEQLAVFDQLVARPGRKIGQ